MREVPQHLKVETLKAYFDRAEALKSDPASLTTIGCILLALGCAKQSDTMLEGKDLAKGMLEGVEALLYRHWDTFKQAEI